MLPRQEFPYHLADDRCAPQAASGEDLEAQFTVRAAHDVHADIMYQRGGAVLRRARDGDLEFARQVSELRVKRRPLANDLAPGPRILELIGCDPRQMIGSNVANA